MGVVRQHIRCLLLEQASACEQSQVLTMDLLVRMLS